jgi:hypothetical protein
VAGQLQLVNYFCRFRHIESTLARVVHAAQKKYQITNGHQPEEIIGFIEISSATYQLQYCQKCKISCYTSETKRQPYLFPRS